MTKMLLNTNRISDGNFPDFRQKKAISNGISDGFFPSEKRSPEILFWRIPAGSNEFPNRLFLLEIPSENIYVLKKRKNPNKMNLN